MKYIACYIVITDVENKIKQWRGLQFGILNWVDIEGLIGRAVFH